MAFITPKQKPINWSAFFQQQSQVVKDQRLQHFYQQGVVSLDTPLKEVDFVALDFETTGLNPQTDGIISVGLVPFNLQRIYCRGSRHWLVKSSRNLNEESIIIHGITHSDLANAPDLKVILDALLESLANKVVVVHYQNIEREFLDKALKEKIGEGILFPMVDTMKIESAVQTKAVKGIWNKLKRKKPASIRLGASRTRYHLPAYQPHHALIDAIATAELLQAQIYYHFSPDTAIGDLWS